MDKRMLPKGKTRFRSKAEPRRADVQQMLDEGLETLRGEPMPAVSSPESVWQRVQPLLATLPEPQSRPVRRNRYSAVNLGLASVLGLVLLGIWRPGMNAQTRVENRTQTSAEIPTRSDPLAWVADTRTSDGEVDDPAGAEMERIWTHLRTASTRAKNQ